jgi:hypothetical protein
MADLWYYVEDGQQLGPVEFDDLKRAVSTKANAEGILVWTNGFRDWKRAADVKELAAVIRQPPPTDILYTPRITDSNKGL